MLREIQVECYAGERGDERPRRVTIDGKEHLVEKLLFESLEESADCRLRVRRFKLRTLDGITLEVVKDANGNWYLKSEDSVS